MRHGRQAVVELLVILMRLRYAYYKGLDYFSTECIYSPFAYRGFAREHLKELEKAKSSTIIGTRRPGLAELKGTLPYALFLATPQPPFHL